jgi:hypothetical protein
MGQLQPSSTRSDAAEGLLLGKTLGPRMGQRARSCSARRRTRRLEERYLSGILQRIVDREALGLGRGQQRRIGGHKQR